MVRILNFLLLILFTSLAGANNRSLDVVTTDTHSQIGKPLQINIIASNIDQRMATINLDKLKKDFGVYVIESSNKSGLNNSKVQELNVHLYPQHTGIFEIPSLTLGKYSSTASSVSILPALEDNDIITFSSSSSSVSVWQRQQIIITSTVLTQSRFASIHAEDFIHKGVESYTLESTREYLGNGQFRLTASWVLYPLIAGEYHFNFPSINYRLRGKVQRKFIPEDIKISVKELPPYIPPLLPVGKIEVNRNIIKEDSFIDNKYLLSIQISSDDALISTLPNLPHDYLLDEDVIVGESLSRNTTSLKDNLFSNAVNHNIPVTFIASGMYHLPAISYKYFEPSTGKIVTIKIPVQDLFILSTWSKILLIIFLILISITALIFTKNYALSIYNQRRSQNKIINSVLKATSPYELHYLLNEYSKANGWRENMTLKNWLVTWEREKGPSINNAIKDLSTACYTKGDDVCKQPVLNKKLYQFLKN